MESNNTFKTVDDEIEYLTSVKTQQHLSQAQARGIISLFNYYFREKDSHGKTKRLPKQEKQQRWKHYKKKVYVDYNRLVKGTFNSEAALVKRYSDPIAFLKYKLKRTRNLDVTDLNQQDQDWYYEIGGLTDVEQTMYRAANIDSLPKTADVSFNRMQTGEQPSTKRRRFNDDACSNSNNQENYQPSITLDLTQSIGNVYSPSVHQSTAANLYPRPKLENTSINTALNKLNDSLTEYEEEQVQKKTKLAVLLTNEKTKAYMEMYKLKLSSHPELLGLLPSSSLEDQVTAGFDLWLFEYKQSICAKVDDIHDFINQVTLVRSDPQDWNSFLHKWKLQRIFHRDAFLEVWEFVVQELNISVRTTIIDPQEEEHLDLNVTLA